MLEEYYQVVIGEGSQIPANHSSTAPSSSEGINADSKEKKKWREQVIVACNFKYKRLSVVSRRAGVRAHTELLKLKLPSRTDFGILVNDGILRGYFIFQVAKFCTQLILHTACMAIDLTDYWQVAVEMLAERQNDWVTDWLVADSKSFTER